MKIRHVVKTVAVSGAATICAAVFALSVGSGVAGANTLTSGDGNTNLNTIGTVASGTPYSSGQTITVQVNANATLANGNLPVADQGGNYYMEECGAPGGVLPTTTAACEPATLTTSAKTSSGGFSKAFQVFDLPDPGTLGSTTSTAVCDAAPHTCVIGIFVVNPGTANPFPLPHLFSAPFQMDQQADFGQGVEAGLNPGDGTPEVPLAIGLPLAGIALFGGLTLRNRRRRQHAQEAA
jgi:hypothetical protein